MQFKRPTQKDKIYVERLYPTRWHPIAFIAVMVLAGIFFFIFSYFDRTGVPDNVPVDIGGGIMFLVFAFVIRWDYEHRGYKLFPKKKDPYP